MANLVKCKAIVLSENQYKENDKMLVAISDEFGKITISAKGAKRVNSPFLAVSQQFCFSEMSLYEGKNGIYTLSDATLISSFYGLRNDLDNLFSANDIAQISLKVSQEELPDNDLMRLLLNTLFMLSENKISSELAEIIFKIRLVYDEGLLPEPKFMSDGALMAVNHIIMSDFDKIYSFNVSDEVRKELVKYSNSVLKFLMT